VKLRSLFDLFTSDFINTVDVDYYNTMVCAVIVCPSDCPSI